MTAFDAKAARAAYLADRAASAYPSKPGHAFEGEDGDRRCSECNLLPEEHSIHVTLAWIDTRNFTFEGVGEDEDEARDALLAALLAHGVEYGLDANWHEPYLDDTHVRDLATGVSYRDREVIQ